MKAECKKLYSVNICSHNAEYCQIAATPSHRICRNSIATSVVSCVSLSATIKHYNLYHTYLFMSNEPSDFQTFTQAQISNKAVTHCTSLILLDLNYLNYLI